MSRALGTAATRLIVSAEVILRDERDYLGAGAFVARNMRRRGQVYLEQEGFEVLAFLVEGRTVAQVEAFYARLLGVSQLGPADGETLHALLATLREQMIVEPAGEGLRGRRDHVLSAIGHPAPAPPPGVPQLTMTFPTMVELLLTQRCNLRCQHCNTRRAGAEAEADELSTEELLALLAAFDAHGLFRLQLSGGEPLLRDDLEVILRAAAAHRYHLALFSNGMLLRERHLRLFGELAERCRDGFSVAISLDGGAAASHDWFRGRRGAFDGAVAALGKLRGAGVAVAVDTTLHRRNHDELERIVALCREQGVQRVSFHPPAWAGRARESELTYDLATLYDDLAPRIQALRAAHAGQLEVELEVCTAPINERIRGGVVAPAPPGGSLSERTVALDVPGTCNAGRSMLAIAADGAVSPCNMAYGVTLGNVREAPLIDIWNDPAWAIYRGGLDVAKMTACNSCAAGAEGCDGINCRAYALASTGDVYGPLPACLQNAELVGLDRASRGLAEHPAPCPSPSPTEKGK